MEIILTHQNADFDAIASMLAAHKLHPGAVPVLPTRQERNVAEFLHLYGNGLPFVLWADFRPRETVTRVILTDTQNRQDVRGVDPKTPMLIYEHHPLERTLQPHETWVGEDIGAVTTLLVERIQEEHIALTSLEATLLALGIYADTGMMTYGGTTTRDIQAAAWLLDHGAVLDTVQRFLTDPLNVQQQDLFEKLIEDAESRSIQGYDVTVCAGAVNEMISGINSVASALSNVLDSDAVFVLVHMPKTMQLVCRSREDAIHAGDLARAFGGGGHPRAAAATLYKGALHEIRAQIWEWLYANVAPAVRVGDLMSYGAQTVQADEAVTAIIARLRRIGHEGYPVLDGERIVGLLTLRDADKALEHGLKDASVRDVMLGGTVTLTPQDSVARLEEVMVESDWGQIPVVDEGERLIGIVTRTDLIKHWAQKHPARAPEIPQIELDTAQRILGDDNVTLIETVAAFGQERNLPLYMVGGVVRDLLLERANYDIDFVVEADAIEFAEALAETYGGEIHSYRPFGTAKWLLDEAVAGALGVSPEALPDHLDFATARSELYEHPTALPTVYNSGIKLDLRRRDFTINTLAAQLSPARAMWRVIDFYGGLNDLDRGVIRVLHSLSFVDDPTRILRAVRFAERLHFTIEPRTAELIQRGLPMLRRITGERLRNELSLLLKEDDPARGFHTLQALGIPAAIHPAFHVNSNVRGVLQRLADTSRLPDWIEDTHELRWHVLLASHTQDEIADIGERLLFNQTLVKAIQRTSDLLHEPGPLRQSDPRPSEVHARLRTASETTMAALVLLLDDVSVQETIRNYREDWRHRKPQTNGNTLKEMGISPGPHYSEILERLRVAVLDGEIADEAAERALLKEIIAEVYHG